MLESVWFVLWGVLWVVYFVLDGFDLGVGMLLPVLAPNEADKRTLYRAIGPHWDGNEVWLIAAGGVTFAAFPKVYAALFSGLYSPLMLILFGLIVRGVALEFRYQAASEAERRSWDHLTVLGSLLPASLLGVAFANLFRGVPVDLDGGYHGSMLGLLNPYGLLGGVLFVVLFLLHGAVFATIKTEGELHERAAGWVRRLWPLALIVLLAFVGASLPCTRLFDRYVEQPWLFVVPLVPVAGLLAVPRCLAAGRPLRLWTMSALAVAGAAAFGLVGMFPALMPSSLDPRLSLTAFNSASSPLTLTVMLVVVLVFLPGVIAYQVWAYRLFRGPVGPAEE